MPFPQHPYFRRCIQRRLRVWVCDMTASIWTGILLRSETAAIRSNSTCNFSASIQAWVVTASFLTATTSSCATSSATFSSVASNPYNSGPNLLSEFSGALKLLVAHNLQTVSKSSCTLVHTSLGVATLGSNYLLLRCRCSPSSWSVWSTVRSPCHWNFHQCNYMPT